jgi:hypothetical protein
MLKNFNREAYILVLIVLLAFSFTGNADEGREKSLGKAGTIDFLKIAQTTAKDAAAKAAFYLTPREVDLGEIGQGDIVFGVFSIKSIGAGSLQWFTDGPEGWPSEENQKLMGITAADFDYLRLSVKSTKIVAPEVTDRNNQKLHIIQVTLEAGERSLHFRKELPSGTYREMINLNYAGGTRTVYFSFKVIDIKPISQLNVEPPMVDFGVITPGKQATRQIKITNKGRETAKWHAVLPKQESDMIDAPPPLKGRYVSFMNDEIKEGGIYAPAVHLKDVMETSGKWQAYEGCPSAYGVNNFVRVHFSGKGLIVYLWRSPEGGRVAVYVDDQLISVYDCSAPERRREEFNVADGLSEGPHILTLANGDGRVIVEGVSVYDKEPMKGNPGWIKIFPDSGTTTRETDYVHVRIDAQKLHPGYYGEQVVFTSNRGDGLLDVYVEVKPDQLQKVLDVYRYVRNYKYFYTSNPPAEANKLQIGGYRKEGIAFRLFAPGTPGTTEFYRWYSASKGNYFYSYDLNGGGVSLKSYVFEGSIGNIGTSKLTNSRELYRWFNPSTGRHFYTTDEKGEGISRKGYKFDGIAGYVR